MGAGKGKEINKFIRGTLVLHWRGSSQLFYQRRGEIKKERDPTGVKVTYLNISVHAEGCVVDGVI